MITALASNDETTDHIETLFETKSLTDEKLYTDLINRLNTLGKKLNSFIKSVQEEHQSPR
ncbi:MAG: four helix bundle protein [Bacteroidetes bacterium]|nr:four helix bundle protein [Bacteroidota bacterium]